MTNLLQSQLSFLQNKETINYYIKGISQAKEIQYKYDQKTLETIFKNAFKNYYNKLYIVCDNLKVLYKNSGNSFWKVIKPIQLNDIYSYKKDEELNVQDFFNIVFSICLISSLDVNLEEEIEPNSDLTRIMAKLKLEDLWVYTIYNEINIPRNNFIAQDIIIQKPKVEHSLNIYNNIMNINNIITSSLKTRLIALNTLQNTNSFKEDVLIPFIQNIEQEIQEINDNNDNSTNLLPFTIPSFTSSSSSSNNLEYEPLEIIDLE